MRISDWSSDVCSSDLRGIQLLLGRVMARVHKDLRFADVPKRTEALRVETGAGPVTCTVYRPPGPTAAPAPVYVNLHGGGFVVRSDERRVGIEGVGTCRHRWHAVPQKKNHNTYI